MSAITSAMAGAMLSLYASVSPSSASGSNSGFGPSGSVTSNSVTVTPINPVGSISYAWARVSGSVAITADFPTAATTDFSGAASDGVPETATFRCTITDASTGQTATVDVPVDLTWTNLN